jgi:uncharacterized protein YbaP (TraB family)
MPEEQQTTIITIVSESDWFAPEMKAFGKTNEERSIGSAGDQFVAEVTSAFVGLGLPTEDIWSMSPYYASMLISQELQAREGCSGEHGLDSHLLNRAKADRKIIGYLESPLVIDEIAKSIPFEAQVAELRRAIEMPEAVSGRMRRIVGPGAKRTAKNSHLYSAR